MSQLVIIDKSFNYKINVITIEIDRILPLFLSVEGFLMENFHFFVSFSQESTGLVKKFLIVLRH